MPPVIAYTLPAMQLVCNLVALGNVISSIPVVEQSPLQPPQPKPEPLPEDYKVYPDIGVAYKLYNRSVTPIEARNLCAQGNAQLAVIDSFKKVEYIKQHMPIPDQGVHAGIIRFADTWVNLNTGLPVPSIPWNVNEPSTNHGCASLYKNNIGLGDYACIRREHYVCEIPLPANIVITAN